MAKSEHDSSLRDELNWRCHGWLEYRMYLVALCMGCVEISLVLPGLVLMYKSRYQPYR